MNVALTGNEHLLCFGVIFILDGGIFFDKSCDTLRDLVFLALALGDDCSLIEGFGINNLLIRLCRGICGKGVVCVCIRELSRNADVAAAENVDLGLLFAADCIDMGKLFRLLGSEILEFRAALEFAVHNLEERHFTDERVGDRLEYEYRGSACF